MTLKIWFDDLSEGKSLFLSARVKLLRLSYKIKWLPTVDNLRNFFLRPTTEMLSFFQILRRSSLPHTTHRASKES
jgi:hypothetical protein